jgi:hypothetical protein
MMLRDLLLLSTLPLGCAQSKHHETDDTFWLSLAIFFVGIFVLMLPMMSWGNWSTWYRQPYYAEYSSPPIVLQGRPVSPASPEKAPPGYEETIVAPASSGVSRFSFFGSKEPTGAARDRARLVDVPAVFAPQGPGFKV